MALRHDFAWTFVSDVSGRLAPLAVLGVYYLALSPSEGAPIVVAYSYTMVAWLLVDLGMGIYGIREVARNPHLASDLQAEITLSRLVLAVLGSGILLPMLVITVHLSPLEALGFVAYLALRCAAPDWRFRGERRFRELSRCSMAALATMIGVLGLLWAMHALSEFRSLPFALWALTYAVMTWQRSGTSVRCLERAASRRFMVHLKSSFSLSLVNAVTNVGQQVPIIVLSFVMPVTHYAGFALLHRLTVSATIFFTTLGMAVFPRFVKQAAEDYNSAWRTSLKLMIVTLLVSVAIGVCIIVAISVPWVETKFFPGVSWFTGAAMGAYLAFRSLRDAPTRLLLAVDRQYSALLAGVAGLAFFLIASAVAAALGRATVPVVSGLFTLGEALGCALVFLSARSSGIRQGSASAREGVTRLARRSDPRLRGEKGS